MVKKTGDPFRPRQHLPSQLLLPLDISESGRTVRLSRSNFAAMKNSGRLAMTDSYSGSS
jgi:hypothetical protein